MVGVLVYRVFRDESKRSVKILHALLHMMALIISVVGKFRIMGLVCLSVKLYYSLPFFFYVIKEAKQTLDFANANAV